MTSAETAAEQVDEQAMEWLEDKYHFLPGAQVFKDRDMVTAYRAGFAAGLGHARKVFMGEATGSYEFLSVDGSWKRCRNANDAAMWAADGFKVREVKAEPA